MSGAQVLHEAFVTLTTSDAYALGCLVLAHSLRRVQTTRQLVCMVTSGVSQSMRQRLHDVFDVVTTVDVLDSQDRTNLKLLDRQDLGVTFTKLHCWRLTQFTKCVFIDADAMVLRNIDDLFEREELSASPDPGWPDCFNSGVFVFCPNEARYKELLDFAVTVGSFDGGDQGLLNLFFSDWATKDIKHHLPFLYNVVSQAFYSYLPAFKQFGKDAKVVHFIGPVKPWQNKYNTATGKVQPKEGTGHNGDFLQMWWNIFMELVHPTLEPSMTFSLRFIHEEPAPQPPHETGWQPPYQQHFSPPMPPPTPEHAAPTVYHMTMPYVPPILPQTFYEPPHQESSNEWHNSNNHESVSDYVPPPPPREYHFFESHYTEMPISHVDTYTPPPESYHAKEFFDPVTPPNEGEICHGHTSGDSGVMDYSTGSDDGHSEAVQSVSVLIEHSESGELGEGSIEKHSKPAIEETVCELESSISESIDQSVHSEEEDDADDSGSESDVSSVDLTTDEESDFENQDKMGITEELATIQLDMGPGGIVQPRLSDRQRRDMWERGQMDYMGEDKFDNILERISTTLNGSGSTSQTSVEKEQPPKPTTPPVKSVLKK